MSVDPIPATMTKTLDAALAYAALGLRVVPIIPGKKHPPMGAWKEAATTDPDLITNWWSNLYREFGVGIVTGPSSGVWTLDVDDLASLQELLDAYGVDKLPDTACLRTGKGGMHYLFRWDPDRPVQNLQKNPLMPDIDTRGDGGQSVAPPTVHPNGQRYQWVRHPSEGIADAPDWLYQLIAAATQRDQPAQTRTQPNRTFQDDKPSPADRAHLVWNYPELLTKDGWTQMRGEYWCRPGKHPRDGHSAVLHTKPWGPLVVFTTAIPPALEGAGKITDTGDARRYTLFEYATATLFGGDPTATSKHILDQLDGPRTNPADLVATDLLPPPTDTGEQLGTDDIGDPNPLRPFLLTEPELNQLTPPEPLIDGWLNRNSLAFLIGPPKKGKTFIAIDIAMSVACGLTWVGNSDTQPGRVLYVLGEGVAGLAKRVNAWRTARNTWDPANIQFLARPAQLGQQQQVDWLLEIADDYQPDLIIIDTLARASVGIEENSTKEMGEIIASLDRIKHNTTACVLVVHHTGKDATRGARGSSALAGAWDSMLTIDGKNLKNLVLENAQQKDIEDGQRLAIAMDQHDESIVPRLMGVAEDEDQAQGSNKSADAKRALLAAIRRNQTTTGLPREAWLARISDFKAAADIKRSAFNELCIEGYFIETEGEVLRKNGKPMPVSLWVPNRDLLPKN